MSFMSRVLKNEWQICVKNMVKTFKYNKLSERHTLFKMLYMPFIFKIIVLSCVRHWISLVFLFILLHYRRTMSPVLRSYSWRDSWWECRVCACMKWSLQNYIYAIYLQNVKSLCLYSMCSCKCSSLPAAGVLWLSMIAEFMYISLLGMGFLLMWVEVLCAHKEMHALKINAFAAMCTVLSGKRLVLSCGTFGYCSLWQLLLKNDILIICIT